MWTRQNVIQKSARPIRTEKKYDQRLYFEMRNLEMERQGSGKDQEVNDRKEKMGSERRSTK